MQVSHKRGNNQGLPTETLQPHHTTDQVQEMAGTPEIKILFIYGIVLPCVKIHLPIPWQKFQRLYASLLLCLFVAQKTPTWSHTDQQGFSKLAENLLGNHIETIYKRVVPRSSKKY